MNRSYSMNWLNNQHVGDSVRVDDCITMTILRFGDF